MSSFRPLKILCEVTKRQGSTFFNARNYCRDRGVEEKILNLHKTNFVENSHEPKTNPQYLSPPEPANTGWWSFWGGGTKVTKSNLIPPPQDKIFTCVESDSPHTTDSVETKPPLSWYATTWVSFLNKFGIQQVGETQRGTLTFPGQEQAICKTCDDGTYSFSPYTGNNPQLCGNQAEWSSLHDVELSQLCNKFDNTFQVVQLQQIENQANIDLQDAPVLPMRMECNNSLPHRQPPQYSKKMCSGQVQHRSFLKVKDLDVGAPSRLYSTDPIRPDNSAETLAHVTQATPSVEKKPIIICIEKPSKPDTVRASLVPSEPPLDNLESQAAVVDNCLSMTAAVAEKLPSSTSTEMSPSDTKHTPQLDDSSSRYISALGMPSSTPAPAITDSVKSPTVSSSSLVTVPMPKAPSLNMFTVPISDIQSPLPEVIKKDPLPSSQTSPTNCFSSSTEIAMPKVKKKPPSMHKQQPSSKSMLSTTKALDKETELTHTPSQTPETSESCPSVTKVQPVKAKTQEQLTPEQLPTSKPYSSTSKTLNDVECKTSISPKTFSPVIKGPMPKVKIKPSTPLKLPQFKTLPSNTETVYNAKNRTLAKVKQQPLSKAFLSIAKTESEVKKKPTSISVKLPASKMFASPTKPLENVKNRTLTKLKKQPLSKPFLDIAKTESEVKKKPTSISVKFPPSKLFTPPTKPLDNAKNRAPTKLQKLSLSKASPSTTKTSLPEVTNKSSLMSVKLPVSKAISSPTERLDDAKNRTQTKLQKLPSSKASPSTIETQVSEVKKKPSIICVKVPVSKTMSSPTKTDNAKNITQTKLQKPPSSKASPSTIETQVSEVKKKPSLIYVKVPVSKTMSSPTKTDNVKNITQTKLQKLSSSKVSLPTTKAPLIAKKKPSLVSIKVPVSKTMSSPTKTVVNAKNKTPTQLQRPSLSKASLSATKTAISEVKKKPSLISVKVPVSKTMLSPTKTLDNTKNRTPTKLQKLSSSKASPPTTKTPLSEVKKHPSSISIKLSPSETLASPPKALDNVKNTILTKFNKTSSSKAAPSSTKTRLSQVKKKPSLIPVNLPVPRTLSSPSKPINNDKNRTPTKLKNLSTSKVFFPTTKAPLSEVKKKRSGTRTFPSPSKILNNAKTSTLTKFQSSSASKAFSSSCKATLNKTKQIPQLSKTPKHGPRCGKQMPFSFVDIAPMTKRFSSATKATLSHSKTVQPRCRQVTQRSEAFCCTTTTELRNLKMSAPSNIKKMVSSKSFSSTTKASISKLNKIQTSRTKASYSTIDKPTKTYPLPDVSSSELPEEAQPSSTSHKKPPSSHKKQSSSSGNNTSVEASSSTDSTSLAATIDEKDPMKYQSVSGVNKVKDQSHCRRRPGECLPHPKEDRKGLRTTRPEPVRVCPAKIIKKEASCKGVRLPGCVMPTSISCMRHKSPERKPCNKVQAPQPSFSECIRQMPKPPFPTECCTSERYRYLQPSEPMFFLRSTAISPPVIEPYIDPCKGECCTPITTSRDAGDGDSLSNETMGKNSARDAAKAAVYDCLFQGKKLVLPGCPRPKSTVCTATVAVRVPCTRPLAPVPAFSECYKRPFPKRRNTECRVAAQKAVIMADVLSRGLRLTLDAIFEARCKKPGLTKTCEHHEEEEPCGPTSPPRDCAKMPPKSRPNRSCTEKVVEKCHAVPYKMSD